MGGGEGGPVSAAPAGPPGEDEEYEQEVNEMNMVWEVRGFLKKKTIKGFYYFDHQKKDFLRRMDFAMMFVGLFIDSPVPTVHS